MTAGPVRDTAPWKVWVALAIVYVVWGSTYLAIRVQVRTVPPLLGAGVRFAVAGGLVYVVLLLRRGRDAVRVTPSELASCSVVGACLFVGANGLVGVAEREVPSNLAALIISSVPLWVIVYRRLAGERVRAGSLAGVVAGFAGVAILALPGSRVSGATPDGVALLVVAAASWALGSFLSTRRRLPRDLFLSAACQMIAGGVVLLGAAAATGEAGGLAGSSWSRESLLALLYLVTAGSLLGFTAYAWLLQHAPISQVATHAYVNPVVAILLGWWILGEEVSVSTLAGAGMTVASVAFVLRRETAGGRSKGRGVPPREPARR